MDVITELGLYAFVMHQLSVGRKNDKSGSPPRMELLACRLAIESHWTVQGGQDVCAEYISGKKADDERVLYTIVSVVSEGQRCIPK